jgi:predicted TIM-barrel fold metal-dependent hydrolase
MDFNSFLPLPVIDSHIHFVHPERITDIARIIETVPYEKVQLVCIPNPDGTNHNPAALYFKERYPQQTYLSGALDYRPVLYAGADPVETLARQVLDLKRAGFNGLKLIEGKPMVRKLLPFALDAPAYEGMWAALEQEDFPVVLHVADPDEFWDPVACPDWAKTSGWDYTDGSFPSKENLYGEVDHILARHPNLRITLAHFYFMAHDLQRAGRFLDAHPRISFDLTPHSAMYQEFSREPAQARAFLTRYADRMIFGTDTDTRVLVRGESGMRFMLDQIYMIRACLEWEDEFFAPSFGNLTGLGLDRPTLEKIYYSNFTRIYGACPG